MEVREINSGTNPARILLDSEGLQSYDELFLASMALVEESLKLRAKLDTALKLAYFLLAKARFIVGNNRISAAQLPGPENTITASSTVKPSLHEDSDCFYFDLVMNNEPEKEKGDGSGLVHRGSPLDGTEEKQEEEGNNATGQTKKLHSDPLLWFGVLVPQELRQVQRVFQAALKLSVEVANLQLKIDYISKQFWDIINTAIATKCRDKEP